MSFTVSHPEFVPHPWLRNPHAMTIAPVFMPRPVERSFNQSCRQRLFRVCADTEVSAFCHFHADRSKRATVVLLHGLEGSSESAYIVGLAAKVFAQGMNAVRLNMRNCGGSLHLTPTLYNGGLSSDLIAVLEQLSVDSSPALFAVGFSLGGNVVLKAAGELGANYSALKAVAAVSPAIDLALSVQAIERPENRLYHHWFLRALKRKIAEKHRLFPKLYDLSKLPAVTSLRLFDDIYTAPSGGYGRAADYYARASAKLVVPQIAIPTLIITSKDDPLVPFSMFAQCENMNPNVHVLSTQHGGHAAFVQKISEPGLDRFWAENRIVAFFDRLAKKGL